MFSISKRRTKRTTPARITATALAGTGLTVAALVATEVVAVPSWADLDGVDVASHQHPGGAAIDWQQLAAQGQKFAFVKATEGTGYTNPFFTTDSQKAQEAGIMPGSYHYAKPGNRDPRGEARFYATTLATGPQPSLPPALDLEETGGLSTPELQSWVREWVDEIKKQTGRKPIIYTYYAFWKGQMGNTTEFSEYPLWLAYYNDTPPGDIPGGWDEMTFWQYTGQGRLPGVVTDVDLNTYYGDDASLKALASDMPANTTAGAISQALKPIKKATGKEAQVANTIEHVTGVDVPLTTDFMMLVLGVVGGRLPAETLLTQGAVQTQTQGKSGTNASGSSNGDTITIPTAEGARGSVVSSQQILKAVQALAHALNETNANGKQIPVDQLLALARQAGINPGAGNKVSDVNMGQLLKLLQQYGETQDWAGKLAADEVDADPMAYVNLAKALLGATPTEAGRQAAAGLDLPALLRPIVAAAAENGDLPPEFAQLMNAGSAVFGGSSSEAPDASAEETPEAPAAPEAAEAPAAPENTDAPQGADAAAE
ncbi:MULTISPECIES: GH25 family lysozyme [Corynebacterium]|uniref:GH25 family lysozyme n=1 Tax=Corynebacterium TaxID=1716 RepID=UPI00186577FD|nr:MULTISPECIES: GH25 family lysozyme [Corynebacterium]